MTPAVLTRARFVRTLAAGLAAVAVVLALSPGIGSTSLSVWEAWRHWSDTESAAHVVAFGLRMPAALRALAAGMILSLTGAVYQTLFRNVLATPYTLGVDSGASLGAMIAVKLSLVGTVLGLPARSWCAFAGAAAVVTVVMFLAGARNRISGNTLVLAGVTVAYFCSAMMMFLTYLIDVRQTYEWVRWTMGSMEAVGVDDLLRLLVPLLAAGVVLVGHASSLNQYAVGEEIAASRGLRPIRLQVLCVGAASLATACIVSLCGPIGFVGLVVPQAVRYVVGPDHRVLLPAATLWGGVFLIVCHWLTFLIPSAYGHWTRQEVTASALPIGVMTAVIGAPVFLIMLRRQFSRPL